MTSGSNRIRRAKPARPLADVSRLTIRIRAEHLHAVPMDALARLARSLGLDAARRDDETDGEYRHRVARAVQRHEAALSRGVALPPAGLPPAPEIG